MGACACCTRTWDCGNESGSAFRLGAGGVGLAAYSFNGVLFAVSLQLGVGGTNQVDTNAITEHQQTNRHIGDFGFESAAVRAFCSFIRFVVVHPTQDGAELSRLRGDGHREVFRVVVLVPVSFTNERADVFKELFEAVGGYHGRTVSDEPVGRFVHAFRCLWRGAGYHATTNVQRIGMTKGEERQHVDG